MGIFRRRRSPDTTPMPAADHRPGPQDVLTSAPASERRDVPKESDLVFNVVWTGEVFPVLEYFVRSQMAHTTARFRFVANWCTPEQIALMEAFRAEHPDQVIEVLDVSPDVLESHGEALERVRAQRDDGEWFCFIDPDIKAKGPWVSDFLDLLAANDVVTSGEEVWTDDNVVPEGSFGVAGEHFYDHDGFVFGSPHLAFYRASTLAETEQRWGVRLGSAGPDLRPDAQERIAALGRPYTVWDTAKLVNVLIQADGGRLAHRDLPQLVHIGGLSHFISPAYYLPGSGGDPEPEWTRWGGTRVETRHTVTRYTALVLQDAIAGREPTPVPTGLEPAMAAKLTTVHDEVIDLVDRYR